MARNKVKLAWIDNDATRRTTLKKRRKGLLKKVQELTILCGVEACAVVYAPQEQAPVVWPSPAEAARMMRRFQSLPEIERNRKMVSQEDFLRQRIAKLQEQLRRQQRENREVELTAIMYEGLRGRSLHDLSIEEASSLAWMVDAKLRAVDERRDELTKRMLMDALPPTTTTIAVTPPASAAFPMAAERTSLQLPNDGVVAQQPSWLVDMMMPWPGAPDEAGEGLGDPSINPWPDTLFR